MNKPKTQKHPSLDRTGFALMGVLVTIAVIAILAGVLGPMIYRQMMASRVEETRGEMLALENALLKFYSDTGRFPTEGEGLAALVTDPGVAGWQGPYIAGDQSAGVSAITTDGFGEDYAYDVSPTISPAGSTELLLVSGGSDNTLSSGSVGGAWTINDPGDDLLLFIESSQANRDKAAQAREEIQAISEAAWRFFEDNALFPVTTAELSSTYQDGSFAGSAFVDPWLSDYVLEVDNGADPPTMTVSSLGPNHSDDGGAGDDITLAVDSVVPGRRSTYHMIRIAQTRLDSRPATTLSGDWATDREDLDLAAAFDSDGWGKQFEVAMSTRTVLSAGPDGDYFTPEDNIPAGVIPDDVASGSALQLVPGSAVLSGSGCNNLSFQILNTSSGNVNISSATFSWPSPLGYFKKLHIVEDVAERTQPKFGSGDPVNFNSSVRIRAGNTTTVKLLEFTNNVMEGGSSVNMGNVTLSVTLSDGSVVSFTTPSCP